MEGFVKDASGKELVIASVVRVYQQLFGKSITIKLAVKSTLNTLLKNQIFVDVFEIKNNWYAALRKELLIAIFVECFKKITLGKYCDKFYQYFKQFALMYL